MENELNEFVIIPYIGKHEIRLRKDKLISVEVYFDEEEYASLLIIKNSDLEVFVAYYQDSSSLTESVDELHLETLGFVRKEHTTEFRGKIYNNGVIYLKQNTGLK